METDFARFICAPWERLVFGLFYIYFFGGKGSSKENRACICENWSCESGAFENVIISPLKWPKFLQICEKVSLFELVTF